MDAQELQRLKEALEMLKRGASADMKVFPVTSYDTLKAHIDALAERAVSPAESVQSIDTPEFRVLLSAMSWESRTAPTDAFEAALARVFAHIDASRAATHAEGRRSAMEELAKEKGRADRAEAALKERLDKTQWVQDAVQSNKFSVMYLGHHRADVIRQEFDKFAARQAPDLKQIMVIVEKEFDWTDFMPGHKKAIATIKSRLRTLLSSTAQPLQTDAKKAAFDYYEANKHDFMAKSDHEIVQAVFVHLSAHPLQQEGGKDAKPIEKERADFEEWYTTHAFDYEAAPIGSRDCALQWSAWLARAGGFYNSPSDWKISPMPWGLSDNLQQASAAQAEGTTLKTLMTKLGGSEPSDDIELQQLPCPFCGSRNISAGEVLTDSELIGETVTQSCCMDCGALGPGAALADGEID